MAICIFKWNLWIYNIYILHLLCFARVSVAVLLAIVNQYNVYIELL